MPAMTREITSMVKDSANTPMMPAPSSTTLHTAIEAHFSEHVGDGTEQRLDQRKRHREGCAETCRRQDIDMHLGEICGSIGSKQQIIRFVVRPRKAMASNCSCSD